MRPEEGGPFFDYVFKGFLVVAFSILIASGISFATVSPSDTGRSQLAQASAGVGGTAEAGGGAGASASEDAKDAKGEATKSSDTTIDKSGKDTKESGCTKTRREELTKKKQAAKTDQEKKAAQQQYDKECVQKKGKLTWKDEGGKEHSCVKDEEEDKGGCTLPDIVSIAGASSVTYTPPGSADDSAAAVTFTPAPAPAGASGGAALNDHLSSQLAGAYAANEPAAKQAAANSGDFAFAEIQKVGSGATATVAPEKETPGALALNNDVTLANAYKMEPISPKAINAPGNLNPDGSFKPQENTFGDSAGVKGSVDAGGSAGIANKECGWQCAWDKAKEYYGGIAKDTLSSVANGLDKTIGITTGVNAVGDYLSDKLGLNTPVREAIPPDIQVGNQEPGLFPGGERDFFGPPHEIGTPVQITRDPSTGGGEWLAQRQDAIDRAAAIAGSESPIVVVGDQGIQIYRGEDYGNTRPGTTVISSESLGAKGGVFTVDQETIGSATEATLQGVATKNPEAYGFLTNKGPDGQTLASKIGADLGADVANRSIVDRALDLGGTPRLVYQSTVPQPSLDSPSPSPSAPASNNPPLDIEVIPSDQLPPNTPNVFDKGKLTMEQPATFEERFGKWTQPTPLASGETSLPAETPPPPQDSTAPPSPPLKSDGTTQPTSGATPRSETVPPTAPGQNPLPSNAPPAGAGSSPPSAAPASQSPLPLSSFAWTWPGGSAGGSNSALPGTTPISNSYSQVPVTSLFKVNEFANAGSVVTPAKQEAATVPKGEIADKTFSPSLTAPLLSAPSGSKTTETVSPPTKGPLTSSGQPVQFTSLNLNPAGSASTGGNKSDSTKSTSTPTGQPQKDTSPLSEKIADAGGSKTGQTPPPPSQENSGTETPSPAQSDDRATSPPTPSGSGSGTGPGADTGGSGTGSGTGIGSGSQAGVQGAGTAQNPLRDIGNAIGKAIAWAAENLNPIGSAQAAPGPAAVQRAKADIDATYAEAKSLAEQAISQKSIGLGLQAVNKNSELAQKISRLAQNPAVVSERKELQEIARAIAGPNSMMGQILAGGVFSALANRDTLQNLGNRVRAAAERGIAAVDRIASAQINAPAQQPAPAPQPAAVPQPAAAPGPAPVVVDATTGAQRPGIPTALPEQQPQPPAQQTPSTPQQQPVVFRTAPNRPGAYNPASGQALADAVNSACKVVGCNAPLMQKAFGGSCSIESLCNSFHPHPGSQYQGFGQLGGAETGRAIATLQQASQSPKLSPAEQKYMHSVADAAARFVRSGANPNKDPILGPWLMVGLHMAMGTMPKISAVTNDPRIAAAYIQNGQLAPVVFSGPFGHFSQFSPAAAHAYTQQNWMGYVAPGTTAYQAAQRMLGIVGGKIDRGIAFASQFTPSADPAPIPENYNFLTLGSNLPPAPPGGWRGTAATPTLKPGDNARVPGVTVVDPAAPQEPGKAYGVDPQTGLRVACDPAAAGDCGLAIRKAIGGERLVQQGKLPKDFKFATFTATPTGEASQPVPTREGIRDTIRDLQQKFGCTGRECNNQTIDIKNPQGVPPEVAKWMQDRYARAPADHGTTVKKALVMADYAACQATGNNCGYVTQANEGRSSGTTRHPNGYAQDVGGFRDDKKAQADYAAAFIAASHEMGVTPGIGIGDSIIHADTCGSASPCGGSNAWSYIGDGCGHGSSGCIQNIPDSRLREIGKAALAGNNVPDTLLPGPTQVQQKYEFTDAAGNKLLGPDGKPLALPLPADAIGPDGKVEVAATPEGKPVLDNQGKPVLPVADSTLPKPTFDKEKNTYAFTDERPEPPRPDNPWPRDGVGRPITQPGTQQGAPKIPAPPQPPAQPAAAAPSSAPASTPSTSSTGSSTGSPSTYQTVGCTISATPATYSRGTPVTLRWQAAQNALTASISQGVGSVPLSGTLQVTATSSEPYILTVYGYTGAGTFATCSTNGSGGSTDTAPPSGPAPRAAVACAPGAADLGSAVRIAYSCGNSAKSAGNGFDTGGRLWGVASVVLKRSGSDTSTPFTLTCTSEDGRTAKARCDIRIGKPSVTLSASAKTVRAEDTTRLYWTGINVDRCIIYQPDESPVSGGASGAFTTKPLTESMIVRAACGLNGKLVATSSITVYVSGYQQLPRNVEIPADPFGAAAPLLTPAGGDATDSYSSILDYLLSAYEIGTSTSADELDLSFPFNSEEASATPAL